MARQPNPPIGEVDCPRKGCTLKASVHKYRKQAKADSATRFAGRLFCVCPDGHRCDDDQEYLLTQAKLWSPKENVPAPAAKPESSGVSVKRDPKPAPTRSPKPQQQQQPQKPKGFGFW